MRMLLAVHRWIGGLLGLVLALIGASGVALLHQDLWVQPAPPSRHAPKALAEVVAGTTRAEGQLPDYIIFASPDLPFHRVSWSSGAGRYVDASGATIATWETQWQRPELWLFDFHRHLFMGKNGETTAGILALIGLGFVVSGSILWWQRRRAFAPTLLPTRLSRRAILAHHRDLGILVSPLLTLSLLTGAMLAIKPLGLLLVSPWSSPAAIAAIGPAPRGSGAELSANFPWESVMKLARQRFPNAEIRLLTFPKRPGDPVSIRMRQGNEWQPNGRTTVWFSPGDGRMLRALDAAAIPAGGKILDKIYPLHAGKVGGLIYRLALTLSGVGLGLLGSLAFCTFWFNRRPRTHRKRARAEADYSGADELESRSF